MTGPQVGGMPRPRATRYITDWDAVAQELRKHPSQEVLLPEFTDTESVMAIVNSVNRKRGVAALNTLGGKVVAMMRNTRPLTGRRRRGDVWLIWIPGE